VRISVDKNRHGSEGVEMVPHLAWALLRLLWPGDRQSTGAAVAFWEVEGSGPPCLEAEPLHNDSGNAMWFPDQSAGQAGSAPGSASAAAAAAGD